jgi:hypothetical protein
MCVSVDVRVEGHEGLVRRSTATNLRLKDQETTREIHSYTDA